VKEEPKLDAEKMMGDFANFENEISAFDKDLSDFLCDKQQIESNVKNEFLEIDQLLAQIKQKGEKA
jgi:hypothetical protein